MLLVYTQETINNMYYGLGIRVVSPPPPPDRLARCAQEGDNTRGEYRAPGRGLVLIRYPPNVTPNGSFIFRPSVLFLVAKNSCGTLVGALCGDEGCYDPGPGDFDVRVPAATSPGTFNLQVKKMLFADDANPDTASEEAAASSCTASTFTIVNADGTSPSPSPTSQPASAPTNGPTAPTAQPAAAPTANPSSPTSGPTGQPATAPSSSPTLSSPSSSSSSGPGSPGVPPTPVPSKVTCKPAAVVEYSYKLETNSGLPLVTIAHTSGDRDEGGCTNLTGLWEWLATGPEGVPLVRPEFLFFFRRCVCGGFWFVVCVCVFFLRFDPR